MVASLALRVSAASRKLAKAAQNQHKTVLRLVRRPGVKPALGCGLKPRSRRESL